MLAGIVIAALVLVTAATGGVFKPGKWYLSLNKPSWTPPGWVFPVVWTILYCVIAYAGWLVWQAEVVLPILIWGAQLLLNGLWSYLFFGRKNMLYGLIDIILLLALIIAFISITYSISKLSALLFVPYMIWVSIAALLNFRILKLNPEVVL